MTRFVFAARGYVLLSLLALLLVSRFYASAALRPAFLALVWFGMLLRAWAGAHIGLHSNGLRIQTPPRSRTGPYRWLRHPLYLSNLVVAGGLIGFAHSLAPLWAWGLWALVVVHHLWLIALEERAFQKHGAPPCAEDHHGSSLRPSLREVWQRQGRNLLYTVASVLLFWGASRWK